MKEQKQEITATTMYIYERTKTGYYNGRINTSRPLYWEGKVALKYLSDYGYAAGETCATGTKIDDYSMGRKCKNTDWLLYTEHFDCFLLPSSSYPDHAFSVGTVGNVYYNIMSYTSGQRSVRPVFSLLPSVSIKSGNGTIDNPYTLSGN